MEERRPISIRELPLSERLKIFIVVLSEGKNKIISSGQSITPQDENAMRRYYASIRSWQNARGADTPPRKLQEVEDQLQESRKNLERLAQNSGGTKATVIYSLFGVARDLFE